VRPSNASQTIAVEHGGYIHAVLWTVRGNFVFCIFVQYYIAQAHLLWPLWFAFRTVCEHVNGSLFNMGQCYEHYELMVRSLAYSLLTIFPPRVGS
jgi:hypothetical protein